jgi:hypothetical protein
MDVSGQLLTGCFNPWKRTHGNNYIGKWVNCTEGLDIKTEENSVLSLTFKRPAFVYANT